MADVSTALFTSLGTLFSTIAENVSQTARGSPIAGNRYDLLGSPGGQVSIASPEVISGAPISLQRVGGFLGDSVAFEVKLVKDSFRNLISDFSIDPTGTTSSIINSLGPIASEAQPLTGLASLLVSTAQSGLSNGTGISPDLEFVSRDTGISIASSSDGGEIVSNGLTPNQASLLQGTQNGAPLNITHTNVSFADLANLQQQTGNEFAVYTNSSGDRFIAQLGSQGGKIPDNITLIAHTQPATESISNVYGAAPSSDDINAINQLGQTRSYVVTGRGDVAAFFPNGKFNVIKSSN